MRYSLAFFLLAAIVMPAQAANLGQLGGPDSPTFNAGPCNPEIQRCR